MGALLAHAEEFGDLDDAVGLGRFPVIHCLGRSPIGTDVDGFFMEWDTERAGGFEPLRHLPAGKTVVLGLVTSKTGALEKKEDLKRRIGEAAKFTDLDRLCLSPQCGFASTEEGNVLAEDEQWAKLRLCAEVAEEVWGK